MATERQRNHIAAVCDWLVAERALIHYLQRRPMMTTSMSEQQLASRFARHKTISTDCSETVTLVCRFAGLDDPNGRGYDGSGFTGTMLATLPHYGSARAAKVGALVVFGPGAGDHVCIVRKPGPDPLLFSHGQEAGPIFARFSVERDAHKSPATFLSIATL